MATRAKNRRRRLSAEQRRELILQAAAQVFAERGYEGASIDEIAKAAGVTAPVIYHHFASKQALHAELLELHSEALVAQAQALGTAHPPDSAGRLMRHTIEAFFAFVQEHPFAWRMLFRDPPSDPAVASTHRRLQADATRAIAELIAQAPELQLSAELERTEANEILAEAIKSAINGLAGWWWEHPETQREQLVATAMDLLWTGGERLINEPEPVQERGRSS